MVTRDIQTPETYYTDTFLGYNAKQRIGEGEFSAMRNMTSRYYPLLSARDKRGSTPYSGLYDFVPCDTAGTLEGLSQGNIAAVAKENGETVIKFLSGSGSEAKASKTIGGDAEKTQLISQAGYVYAFPQAVRAGTITTDFTPLSNVTSVCRNPDIEDSSVLWRSASFVMQPCDEKGILDDSPRAKTTANQTYSGTGTFLRGTDQLVIVTGGSPQVNEYGTTVYVGSDGVVTNVKISTAETISVTSGGFVLTGNGVQSDWLKNNISAGMFITLTNLTVKVYDSAASSEVVTVKPDSPANGQRWRDSITGSLYVWSAALQEWVAQTQNYILLSFGINDAEEGGGFAFIGTKNGVRQTDAQGNYTVDPFEAFAEGDCIQIEGIGSDYDSSYVISSIDSSGLILNGFIDKKTTRSITGTGSVTISRKVPKMDFVVESNNRLWGCYYGLKDNSGREVLNEIYCCALGDPTNWYKYEGTAMDSWSASVGIEGAWTGAAVYGGYPVFFKENAIIRVYGTAPSSFQLVTYNYRGIKPGSEKSVAIVDEVLYYHSYDGFMAYSGSVPVKIDSALGDEEYSEAVAGSFGGKYFVSAKKENSYRLLVFDTSLNLWHIEDETKALKMCRVADKFYILKNDNTIMSLYGSAEDDVPWYCESGQLGYGDIYRKRVNKIKIKLMLPLSSTFSVSISYDDGDWERCGDYVGVDNMPIDIHFIPKRCDRYRLRFEGNGDCKIISIYRETEYAG